MGRDRLDTAADNGVMSKHFAIFAYIIRLVGLDIPSRKRLQRGQIRVKRHLSAVQPHLVNRMPPSKFGGTGR